MINNNINCTFCHTSFKSISILNKHIISANYCKQIQLNNVKEINFKCNGCFKEFTNKKNMVVHKEKCVEIRIKTILAEFEIKLKNQTEEYENKIAELYKKYKKYKKSYKDLLEITKHNKDILL